MTSLTLNTTTTGTNALLSIPSTTSISKKANTENYITFCFLPKQSSRRSAEKLFSIDWDLNMNELEFE